MSKRYYKSKNNISGMGVVIGDLSYLPGGEHAAPDLVYQATIGKPCSVELVLDEHDYVDPENRIPHPIPILSGSLIVQPCKNVINTENFITVDENLDLILATDDDSGFVQKKSMEIGCDTASVFIGRSDSVCGDESSISTGSDGSIGELTEYRFPKVTTFHYTDGKVAQFASGFAGFIFDFDFDAEMVTADDMLRYISSSFKVEMLPQNVSRQAVGGGVF